MNNISRAEKQKFYQSADWKKLRDFKLAVHPWCQCTVCTENHYDRVANEVHHIKSIDTLEGWKNRLKIDGLQSMSHICHSRVTMQEEAVKKKLKRKEKRYDDVTLRLLKITKQNDRNL